MKLLRTKKKYKCRECKAKVNKPILKSCYACGATSIHSISAPYHLEIWSLAVWYKPWTWLATEKKRV